MRPAPRGESVQRLSDFRRHLREGTLVRQSGPGECLRPYKPHPCHRRPAFPQCDSERWSDPVARERTFEDMLAEAESSKQSAPSECIDTLPSSVAGVTWLSAPFHARGRQSEKLPRQCPT